MDRHSAHAEDVVSNAFGMSAYALWGTFCGYYSAVALQDQRTAFFGLLETLLAEGRIRFVKPGADVYFSTNHVPAKTVNDLETHWMAAPDEIIACLEESWPDTVTSWNDIELTYYFYEIPAVIWRKEDGSWQ